MADKSNPSQNMRVGRLGTKAGASVGTARSDSGAAKTPLPPPNPKNKNTESRMRTPNNDGD
jgi:hypothetical protein